MRKVNNITQLIGRTPIVKLRNLVEKDSADVYLKLEYFNPGGSIKDRPAFNMIKTAQKNGRLKKGGTIIEATSGNTGIGLAMVAAAEGYNCIIIMPDSVSEERIKILKAYGAEVILTPAENLMQGAIDKAKSINENISNSFIINQFENPANPDAHRQSTALEILEQLDYQLDAFVASAGTGGTITGTGEKLKEKIKNLKIYTVESKNSPVLSGGKAGKHKIPGTGPGFIPKNLNTSIYDDIFKISDQKVIEITRLLASKEGLLLGPSSGAAAWAAIKVAKELGKGKNVLAIAADNGERYLSQDYFSN
ncbi:cysteine synthase A [Halanaerobium hydrogeniformans]|uniref:Cysteine synthase n=1 Tax=Halanaerobium hydrogeniformans TaxID=656519 RepID=E4RIR9_HALHG|nr:cysteine synthase A [Halanaerobium hydrogeniformans]ADQ15139.1 cysteine synthase A [Halanaerobium hydrogeniformans]